MAGSPQSEGEASHWFKKGNEFLSSGLYQDAIESFDKALQINPEDSDIWNNRGLALASQNRFEDAIRSFDKAKTLNPLHPDAWYNKGLVLCALELLHWERGGSRIPRPSGRG